MCTDEIDQIMSNSEVPLIFDGTEFLDIMMPSFFILLTF